MFASFNNQAIQALIFAEEEARLVKSPVVSSEYILLGLLREGTSPASAYLQQKGLTLAQTRAIITQMEGDNSSTYSSSNISFTPKMQAIFDNLTQAAQKAGLTQISAEDLLLAIIRDQKTIAASILQQQGVDLENISLDLGEKVQS